MRSRACQILVLGLIVSVLAGCRTAPSLPLIVQPCGADDRSGIDPSPVLKAENTDAASARPSSLSPLPSPITVCDDLTQLFPDLWDDAKSVATLGNGLILGTAAGASVALRQEIDGQVRDDVARHPLRWDDGTRALRVFGEPGVQVPAMFALYGYSVWQDDTELHDFSRALIHAHAVTSLATVAIKGAANTSRPSDEFLNGRWGFPSFHSASTFAIAATVDEYYGLAFAAPCYALAGLVGWSRIDQREHDLSDVVFGSLLGFVVGHSVAARHLQRDNGWELHSWYDADHRASGLQWRRSF